MQPAFRDLVPDSVSASASAPDFAFGRRSFQSAWRRLLIDEHTAIGWWGRGM